MVMSVKTKVMSAKTKVVADTGAIQAAKLKAPEVLTNVSLAQLKDLFEEQVTRKPIDSQRNHPDRIAAGKAPHITSDPSRVESSAAQFDVFRVKVNGILKPKLYLVDGYHRLEVWFATDCPFESVNLIVHTIEVTDEEEIPYRVDNLFRSINSLESAKKNADYFVAAIRTSFGHYGVAPTSRAYTLGTGAVSVFGRVIGPAATAMPILVEKVSDSIQAHIALDAFYCFMETKLKRIKSKYLISSGDSAKKVTFHSLASGYATPGVLYGIFKFFEGRGDCAKALDMLKSAFLMVEDMAPTGESGAVALAKELAKLSNPVILANITAGAKNKEGEYDRIAEALRPVFESTIGVVLQAKKVTA